MMISKKRITKTLIRLNSYEAGLLLRCSQKTGYSVNEGIVGVLGLAFSNH